MTKKEVQEQILAVKTELLLLDTFKKYLDNLEISDLMEQMRQEDVWWWLGDRQVYLDKKLKLLFKLSNVDYT